ncbi:Uncharacterised protein [Oligella ureolytica]|uniref:Uncharacterized protein n=1 Tax=Oligella ureolytica TaxID=90244 RepID=A0A378XEU8_9BURK|nr:hypothetical protein [Oligella ureolytica]SUA51594.1 Uncharacterised protein [Oligella ureolytica]
MSEQEYDFLDEIDFDAIEEKNNNKIDTQEVIEDDNTECESCKI